MYHALHKSRLSSSFIIQDLALPWPAAGDFIHYLNEKFDRYPLWLCPIKPHPQGYASFHPQILPASKSPESQRVVHGVGEEEDTMLLNVGLWTPGPSSHRAFIEANRALEHMVYSLGGAKWLYAQTFYTENEFWTIYDRETYDALRKKYHSSLLPSVYDKVKTDPAASTAAFDRVKYLRPLPGIYGVLRATIGGGNHEELFCVLWGLNGVGLRENPDGAIHVKCKKVIKTSTIKLQRIKLHMTQVEEYNVTLPI
ncbi:hypothetical protein CISG_04829 [Coccidioides immitis RMSCC 3703]|uniref:Uncharacterized protein n=2 Tax=Coccidioides immitis TaxID=5501 RepID=A0A0J8QSD0_COCIT|nr:hypothetical protein CISG_04829 [Coccidioides immitis RMSCC 3703]